MLDKVVNHLVSRYILYPAILPCLLDVNVASRKNMGTKKGLELFNKYNLLSTIKFSKYYILKADISKFFASIDHDILKDKLKRRIKDKDALKIVFDIIDSFPDGLCIGNMTSQILAIFYLNDIVHVHHIVSVIGRRRRQPTLRINKINTTTDGLHTTMPQS